MQCHKKVSPFVCPFCSYTFLFFVLWDASLRVQVNHFTRAERTETPWRNVINWVKCFVDNSENTLVRKKGWNVEKKGCGAGKVLPVKRLYRQARAENFSSEDILRSPEDRKIIITFAPDWVFSRRRNEAKGDRGKEKGARMTILWCTSIVIFSELFFTESLEKFISFYFRRWESKNMKNSSNVRKLALTFSPKSIRESRSHKKQHAIVQRMNKILGTEAFEHLSCTCIRMLDMQFHMDSSAWTKSFTSTPARDVCWTRPDI